MQWRGKTDQQRHDEIRLWHRLFCLFPRQMVDGRWIWLETIWARAVDANVNGRFFWEYSTGSGRPSDDEVDKGEPPNPRRT